MNETLSCMQYFDNMEIIESDIMSRTLASASSFDFKKYTNNDVISALNKDYPDDGDFAALLSPAAGEMIEMIAERARRETIRYFGNSVTVFTPLYISNYCENSCLYCGFNCKNKIKRARLSSGEIEKELKAIASTGLQNILILTGESRSESDINYIGEAVSIATRYFSTIGIEVYPMNCEEYRYIKKCGADFVCVYQETYSPEIYEAAHASGPKRSFPYRFNALERALIAGMRGVAFGSLLGLGDFREDSFLTGVHAKNILKKYPHAEISFSFPRLRPFINSEAGISGSGVSDRQLLQVMLAYRIFMPFADITISTREAPYFRDNVIGLAATRISAGVSVGVGGHSSEAKGDEQFDISDPRTVGEIHNMIVSKGLQPVYNNYIRV